MSDLMLGEIKMFAGNFAPRGYELCNGQLLSIAEYTPLYALLGTMFGGYGTTHFALPDLRGRVPVHAGQGPGLENLIVAQAFGTNSNQLTTTEVKTKDDGDITTNVVTSQTVNNSQPSLSINFIIAVVGIFPNRE